MIIFCVSIAFAAQALQEQRQEEVQKPREEEVRQQEQSQEVPVIQPQQEQKTR